MQHVVCIRKEYKGQWERRTPLTPEAVKALVDHGISITFESSPERIFEDALYREAGAREVPQGQGAQVVLGIKEPPLDIVRDNQVHVAFSHTIKGQPENMALLKTFLDKKATLVDYETITDPNTGGRLIAFGRYAGIAGAIDTFYVAGAKQAKLNETSVLSKIRPTYTYETIQKLKTELAQLKPEPDEDLRVVIVGTGNVGRGAEEVCRWLGLSRIDPSALREQTPKGHWYCVLGTADIVQRDDMAPYERSDYIAHGAARYHSTFHRYLGKFDILLQTPYWDAKYPRQLTREQFIENRDRWPLVIGDITCDIGGSLACTMKASTIDQPAFAYDPVSEAVRDGIHTDGVTVMAIDHLPCELSRDASEHFSLVLRNYVPEFAAMDLDQPLAHCGLSPELQKAVIVYNGELTESYQHLAAFLPA